MTDSDQVGALIDADTPRNQAAPGSIAALPTALLVATAQVAKKLTAKTCIAIHPAIDRLDADVHPRIIRMVNLRGGF